MHLVISGYYGYGNTGDEAILAALTDELRRRYPDVRLTVLSAVPEATARQYGVEAIPRWSLPAIWRALRGADLLISGGGGLIQDTTSRLSPLYYLANSLYDICPGAGAATPLGYPLGHSSLLPPCRSDNCA